LVLLDAVASRVGQAKRREGLRDARRLGALEKIEAQRPVRRAARLAVVSHAGAVHRVGIAGLCGLEVPFVGFGDVAFGVEYDAEQAVRARLALAAELVELGLELAALLLVEAGALGVPTFLGEGDLGSRVAGPGGGGDVGARRGR